MKGRVVGALVLGLGLSACGGDPSTEDVAASLREQRAGVSSAADSIARVLGDPDLVFEGGPRQVGGGPSYTVTFGADALWTRGRGSQQDRIADVGRQIAAAGWAVDEKRADVVVLSKNGLVVTASRSALRGSDDVGISISGETIKASRRYLNEELADEQSQVRP